MSNIRTYLQNILKHTTLVVILSYFIINIFFVFPFWTELWHDNSQNGAVFGEILATEWNMEKVYQNILQGNNPFAGTLDMLYPFGTNYITTDSGNGFLFLLTRPFLSTHQSFFILAALALFFSNLGMYLLLKKLQVRTSVAFLIGLCFGYMTFIHPRIGHLTYLFYYTFPWFYFCALMAFTATQQRTKIMWSVIGAFFFVMTLYLNLYFFVSLILSIAFLLIYYLIVLRMQLFKTIWTHIVSLISFCVATSLLIAPWLSVFVETSKFEELPKTPGWGGAIDFSSDLFGYFVPSIYSYFLGSVSRFIGEHFVFAYGIFENFSYPGIVILSTIGIVLLLYIFKKMPTRLDQTIKPFLWITAGFWVLTLGPFLHVLGKWGIVVDDGIRIVFPLPYIIFHYIPFMSNIRSPGRLMVVTIFFAYIVVAFVIDYWLKKKSARFIQIFVFIFMLIFVFDHYFVIPQPGPTLLPKKIYTIIKNDPAQVSVMEMPSVIRDGFTYFGDSNSLDFITAQQYHDKPILGGYMGRVPQYKRDYYVRNPFLGYVGRLMDPDIKKNGSLNRSDADLAPWKKLNSEESLETIDFLDIAYVVVNRNVTYLSATEEMLKTLGYTKIQREDHYDLWYRKPVQREFTSVTVSSPRAEMYLAAGWNNPDTTFRWAGKKPTVLFKITKNTYNTLSFTAASFYKPQNVKVYINKKYLGTVQLSLEKKMYTVPLQGHTVKGINTVQFIFDQYTVPAEVIPGSTDMRQLSAQFFKVSLQQ